MDDPMETNRHLSPAERRARAPHPGLAVDAEYLRPLGLDAHAFAALIAMDGERLAAMLAGQASIDVDAAVRFGRSLGLPPERIMRAQMRHDFALSREIEHLMPIPPTDTLVDLPFPKDAIHGHLARTEGAEVHEMLFFVADEGSTLDAGFDRIHPIRPGDRLRVYASDGTCVWAGPALRNLDGAWLFAFASPRVWESWFLAEARADFVAAPR